MKIFFPNSPMRQYIINMNNNDTIRILHVRVHVYLAIEQIIFTYMYCFLV